MSKKRVMFASSEVYPFVKTGGLADVSHSLPKALRESYAPEVILPLYRQIDREEFQIVLSESFTLMMGGNDYDVELYETHREGIRYRFVSSPILTDREFLYGPPECGYEDNGLRFALFCRAITEVLRREAHPIVHLNDWQCALVALLVKEDPSIETRTLYTIHNLSYQGIFPRSVLAQIGVDEGYFTMEGLEFFDQVSFMKGGIAYADAVSTVSPQYAKEILTPQFGCGLEGFLHHHRHKLHGILNGIDTDHFSPAIDSALVETYTKYKGKKPSKSALLKELGLKGSTKPLFVFIGRFTEQKGIDLLIETLPKMAELECNIALLGEGEGRYSDALRELSENSKNIRLCLGYDESLSHRMYAAADFVIVPSLFEPCGLSQMIAFAYGAVPVVSRVGGLVDSVRKVESFDDQNPLGFGIVFSTLTPRALLSAIKKGCELYEEKKLFESIANHNIGCDYSWSRSLRAYDTLYTRLAP
jgi:starch synthase